MSHHSNPPAVVAYSYIRFSHPDQAKGDSLRRQTEAAVEWCARNNVQLDTATTLRDLGKSAYTGKHRENPDRHALAAFLKLVEQGKVPRGSYLVLENLDRLSREHIQPALLLALNLLQAGVRIVQLKPSEIVFDDQSDTLPVMMMMMELSRGHGESAIKSERVGKAWRERKRKGRENGEVITHRLPAWIEERGGNLHLIPERAAVVKHIFDLARAGYGQLLIIKKLAEEGVKPFGRFPWSRGYLHRILNDRRALGEFQPHKRNGEADGEVIKGYFPAVIQENEWHAARGGQEQRRRTRGRVGEHVNVFTGLLFNAREGDAYYAATRPTGGNRSVKRMQRLLVNYNSIEGRAKLVSFPVVTFERSIFSKLREIDPHEILNGDAGPDETLVLSGELARVQSKRSELESELLNGDVASLARVLRQLEAQEKDIGERLAAARQKAANPLSESWGEAQTLLETLDNAPDPKDARLRLRTALRRIVESIWLLVIPRGRDRLCAAQIWFAGGKRHRDYLIFHRPPKANKAARQEGGWRSWSLSSIVAESNIDLRVREHAEVMEAKLSSVDLARLE